MEATASASPSSSLPPATIAPTTEGKEGKMEMKETSAAAAATGNGSSSTTKAPAGTSEAGERTAAPAAAARCVGRLRMWPRVDVGSFRGTRDTANIHIHTHSNTYSNVNGSAGAKKGGKKKGKNGNGASATPSSSSAESSPAVSPTPESGEVVQTTTNGGSTSSNG